MEANPFWAGIAVRAATIDERLSGKYIPEIDDDAASVGSWASLGEIHQQYLQQWCEYAVGGDRERFARRLARDGLEPDEVAPLLGNVKLRDGEELPEWVHTARAIFDAIMSGGAETSESCPPKFVDEIPFADLMWPAVVQARTKIGAWETALLTDRAKQDFAGILIRRMAKVYERTLYESFDGFRQAVGIAPEDAKGKELYDSFKSALLSGPFANLVANRPVMIRLLATIVGQWITTTDEFINRLEDDRAGLGDHFPELGDAGAVCAIAGGISDAHDHGRTVLVLTFENGARIVYKPRPVGMEAAWYGLSNWLEQSGSDIRAGAARTWCRSEYGWMAFVEHQSELSARDAKRFYSAAGQLLALMYCIKGSDMHHENLLVADGRPVVIDLETLFQPELRQFSNGEPAFAAKEQARHLLDNGVMAVGLLPKRVNVMGQWLDGGGLATAIRKPVTTERLVHVNQGNMVLEPVRTEQVLTGMELSIDGEPARVADHVADLVDGFRAAISFLSGNREAFLAADGPLAAFENMRIRHVFRPTAYYQDLEQAVSTPQNQQNGFVWSLHFERLARRARWDLDDYPGWGLLVHERRALTRMDIPLFTGRTDQDGVWADGQLVLTDFTASAVLPQIGKRLDQLAGRLVYDSAIIRQTVLGMQLGSMPPRKPWPDVSFGQDLVKRARQTALSIGKYVADQAIVRNGSATWMTADATPDGEGLAVTVMDDLLYGGTTGVALFLAGCHALDPSEDWRDLALAGLAAPRQAARQEGYQALGPASSIGGFDGIGGLIYVLCRCAVLLKAPELLDDAVRLSGAIDAAAIDADKAFDVISGVSGTILALLALHRETGDRAVLDRAILCGRHLPEDPADWKSFSDRALAGISHGAAGVICALLRLYRASGETQFLGLAKCGLEYERSLFDPSGRGWPDLRGNGPLRDPVQWCHGAAGIGLARMATLDVLDDPTIRGEIETAIAVVIAVQDGGRDNLCCGHAGRFSMLRYALELGLGPDGLDDVFNRRLSAWIGRLDASETVGLMAGERMFQTGLMQGLPGIGQVLLEIAAPDQVTPVLALN